MAEAQSLTEPWEAFREDLRNRVTPVTWQTWLAPLRLGDSSDGNLRVLAPSELHRRWVSEKYRPLLEEAAARVFGDGFPLLVEARQLSMETTDTDDQLVGEDEHTGPDEEHGTPAPAPATSFDAGAVRGPTGLIGRYSFENFVVGSSNRFAHAAAMAVAENPGSQYNPLFIYGGAGLGKTHLLHAVGHHAMELRGSLVIRYVSSESFFNEFIEGIRRKRMNEFKSRYRQTDILLLDDVQFFEGKEQILEEFFHTFNSLYESGKQMVISSDRPPKHLATLEERLRSRFEWGLLTDIQPPDVETRLAILRKNAEFAPQPVPEEVLDFIARHVSDNIRELEGALTRVSAYAALTGQRITLEMSQDVLQDLVPAETQRPLTADEILGATASTFGFAITELQGPSRRQPLVRARQVGMYLCRDLTDLSLPKIGALFGGRDHTTVMHAVDKIKRLMQSDQQVFDVVTALSQNLRRT